MLVPCVQLLLVLLCAHALGDFVFQTSRTAANKHRLQVLLGHSLLHGLLAGALVSILAGLWQAAGFDVDGLLTAPTPRDDDEILPLLGLSAVFLRAALVVFILHGLIDLLKSRVELRLGRTGKGPLYQPWAYAIDQALHVLVLAVLALSTAFLAPTAVVFPAAAGTGLEAEALAAQIEAAVAAGAIVTAPGQAATLWATLCGLVAAAIFVTRGAGFFVGSVLKPWVPKRRLNRTFDELEEERSRSRAFAGGAIIGHCERLLILTLVLLGGVQAIALLLAAKSIFRFGGGARNDFGIGMYILMGTLLSFLVGLLLSLGLKGLLSLAGGPLFA